MSDIQNFQLEVNHSQLSPFYPFDKHLFLIQCLIKLFIKITLLGHDFRQE